MHPARERSLVAMQCAALTHLERHAPRLPLPRVVATRKGHTLSEAPGPDGMPRLVWMLSWIPGRTLAAARPRSAETLTALGRLLGELDRALADFTHADAERDFSWDLSRASAFEAELARIPDPSRRALAARALARFAAEVVPALPQLRRQVIHGDANDHNVVLGDPRELPRPIAGLLDFGDMHYGLLVAEPAIAAAYALLGEEDPLAAMAAVVSGYHAALPLEEPELALFPALVAARLAVSVVVSAKRTRAEPERPLHERERGPRPGRRSRSSTASTRASPRPCCARRARCRRSPRARSSPPGSPGWTPPRCWISTCTGRRTGRRPARLELVPGRRPARRWRRTG